MKREELKADKAIDWTLTHDKYIEFYRKEEADAVMEAYEQRIKELESDVEHEIDLQHKAIIRINDLEAQLENVQSSMYAENVDANMALVKANERIKELECDKAYLENDKQVCAKCLRLKELEAENARLKAMKWISVDDVKPQWGKEVKVKFKDGSEDEVRFSHDYKWVSKGMGTCESSEVTHWTPLPTTEESSATEKDG